MRLLVGAKGSIQQESITLPSRLQLDPNFPNPFNPTTTIRYGLPEPGRVTLTVFNILGQQVRRLLDGVGKKAGYTTVIWDGRDDSGVSAPSGLYILQLTAGRLHLARKITLMK